MRLTAIFFVLSSIFSSNIFCQNTVSQNVKTFSLRADQLNTDKKIWVYLPQNYQNSSKSYPVVYMHDGQNLFDETTSYVGEWQIDEILDKDESIEIIIVGIEHGGENRIKELTPFPNEKYGGGDGDDYLNFIVNILKPYIDSNFRTKSNKQHTAIFGSSLGGLISFYALIKYPNVFSTAGVFSPSFWFSEEIFNYTKNNSSNIKGKMYIMAGEKEEGNMVENAKKMEEILKNNYPNLEVNLKIAVGGEHNEGTWSKEFPDALHWLMK